MANDLDATQVGIEVLAQRTDAYVLLTQVGIEVLLGAPVSEGQPIGGAGNAHMAALAVRII